jgi:putative GTP pyrophosphokinase
MSQEEIIQIYNSIEVQLNSIAEAILSEVNEMLTTKLNLERITKRVKSRNRFVLKSLKTENGVPKYPNPFIEVQDLIGLRMIVFYKSDVIKYSEIVSKFLDRVEKKYVIPDDVKSFGYEGYHMICRIPEHILKSFRSYNPIPQFFELQIKTLYQHAWAEAEHDLGYKPDSIISDEDKRRISFVAAQSWGADEILDELYRRLKLKENLN